MGINVMFFNTRRNAYMYDGNTGQILPADNLMKKIVLDYWGKSKEEIVDDLLGQHSHEAIAAALNRIDYAKSIGLLKECPKGIWLDTILNEAKYDLENNKGMICLAVTQSCNLRCEYCAYSGLYENSRTHSDKVMSLETAKKAIDYLMSKSSARCEVNIGFYGGEPLLKFDLIKQCVDYVKAEYEGKKITFSITTNGTLLKGECAKFMAENEFTVHISLDGPEEYHDEYRKFAGSGQGTFNIIIENILDIKRKYPRYFEEHVCFGITLSPFRSLERLEDFLLEANFVELNSYVRISRVTEGENLSIYDVKRIDESSDVDIMEQAFMDLRYMHAKIHENKEYLSKSKVALSFNQGLEAFHRDRVKKVATEKILPKGCCIPGGDKLYVSTEGELFTCEKCSEISDVLKLGDIENGIDFERVRKIVEDFYMCTEEECVNCWMSMQCTACPVQIETADGLSRQKKLSSCNSIKLNFRKTLSKYMTILERNPYAFE